MREAVAAMRNTDLSIAAIVSAGELFCRFITLSLDDKHMEECRQIMLNRGKIFLTKLLNSRQVSTSVQKAIPKHNNHILCTNSYPGNCPAGPEVHHRWLPHIDPLQVPSGP